MAIATGNFRTDCASGSKTSPIAFCFTLLCSKSWHCTGIFRYLLDSQAYPVIVLFARMVLFIILFFCFYPCMISFHPFSLVFSRTLSLIATFLLLVELVADSISFFSYSQKRRPRKTRYNYRMLSVKMKRDKFTTRINAQLEGGK